jgi:hypothetical protein
MRREVIAGEGSEEDAVDAGWAALAGGLPAPGGICIKPSRRQQPTIPSGISRGHRRAGKPTVFLVAAFLPIVETS